MRYFTKFLRIGMLILMMVFASAFVMIRRFIIFFKEKGIEYFSLSKEYIDPFSSNDSNEFSFSCEACPYRHMVDRGYKPVVWVKQRPFILLALLQYILYIKGHVSKADLISFILDD